MTARISPSSAAELKAITITSASASASPTSIRMKTVSFGIPITPAPTFASAIASRRLSSRVVSTPTRPAAARAAITIITATALRAAIPPASKASTFSTFPKRIADSTAARRTTTSRTTTSNPRDAVIPTRAAARIRRKFGRRTRAIGSAASSESTARTLKTPRRTSRIIPGRLKPATAITSIARRRAIGRSSQVISVRARTPRSARSTGMTSFSVPRVGTSARRGLRWTTSASF